MSDKTITLQTKKYEHPTQAMYQGTVKRPARRVPVPDYMDAKTTSDPEPIVDVGPTAAELDRLDRLASGSRKVIRIGQERYLILFVLLVSG